MSFRLIAFGALLMTACGGSTTSATGPDASTPPDAAITPPTDAALSDAPFESSTADADAAGDASIVSDGATTCSPGPETASRQSVAVVVTNNATADRYLVTAGNWCDPYSFSFSQQAPLALNLGFQCLCECPNPGPARPGGLHRLAPGESFTLTWDARSLTTCSQSVDCATMGWPGLGSAPEVKGAKSPVAEGSYWVSVAALTAVPAGCFGDGTTFSCTMTGSGPGSPSGNLPSAVQTMCPGDVGGSAVFTLPATGDTSVAVSITK